MKVHLVLTMLAAYNELLTLLKYWIFKGVEKENAVGQPILFLRKFDWA